MRDILKIRKASPNDIHKVLDELLAKSPFVLAFVYVALADQSEELLTRVEAKAIIEKNTLSI